MEKKTDKWGKKEFIIIVSIIGLLLVSILTINQLLITNTTQLSINSPVNLDGASDKNFAPYTSNSNEVVIKGSTDPNANVSCRVISDGGKIRNKPFMVNVDKKTGNFKFGIKSASIDDVILIDSKVSGKSKSSVEILLMFPNFNQSDENIDLESSKLTETSKSTETQINMELSDYEKGYEHGYLDGWYGDYYNSFSGEFGVGYQKGYEYGSSDHYQDLKPEFEIYGTYTRWEP